MNMKAKKVLKKAYIELNNGQIERLAPLFDLVEKGSAEKKPVLLLAQITSDGIWAVASCGVIEYETGQKIQATMSEKSVGKTVGLKHFEAALKKARS